MTPCARKLLVASLLAFLAMLLTPILWSTFSPHAYFEAGRCGCGHRILVRLKDDGYYNYSPGHGMPEYRAYGLRRQADEWEVFALPQPSGFWSPRKEGEVVARVRMRPGGGLCESWGSKTNWVRLPRVYNLWRVWWAEATGAHPQPISCINNLKQIGLSFKIWSGDNQDLYPFHLSTNAGGTRELCLRDADGFDRRSWIHMLVLSNELNTPKVLVCPEDRSRTPATNWAELGPQHVTYRVRSGPGIAETNTTTVMVICPVDGNVVFCDGSVKPGKSGAH